MRRLASIRDLTAERFPWKRWERLIESFGVVIDRPVGTAHPEHPSIIYPIDYGYLPGTTGSDGHPVDVFVGSGKSGLVALIITADHRKGDREFKLIHNCTPPEVYLVNGFINYDHSLMEGELVMRRPMIELWGKASPL